MERRHALDCLCGWHPDPGPVESILLGSDHPLVCGPPACFFKQIFPAPVYYVSLVLWSIGNFLLWYLTVLTARHSEQDGLVGPALLIPLYWVMMSMAALKAAWQLVVTPSFWEKTQHGLTPETTTRT